jgi:hypothetical protein
MVGSDLTHKHYTRLARDKHTNFLQAFVNYDRKKVYDIGALALGDHNFGRKNL